MNQQEMLKIMEPFRQAFGTASAVGLRKVLTTDFEWHMHFGDHGRDDPTGKVLYGIEEMVRELKWRGAHWSNMKFSDLVERPAGDVILQMFTTSGTNENGSNYNVNVVDVYTIRGEKISRKDTYWKNITPSQTLRFKNPM